MIRLQALIACSVVIGKHLLFMDNVDWVFHSMRSVVLQKVIRQHNQHYKANCHKGDRSRFHSSLFG